MDYAELNEIDEELKPFKYLPYQIGSRASLSEDPRLTSWEDVRRIGGM